MTFRTPPESGPDRQVPTQTPSTGLRLPIARPVVTYVLLGVIVLAFAAEMILLQLTGVEIAGAQWNQDVGAGQYWQLLTSMFVHDTSTLAHIAFNGYALFVLGRDTEGLYGSASFAAIYLLSGLAGSVAWYLLGSAAPTVGASGAIFGLIGAEAAFFLRNRGLFGPYAKVRLRNIAVLLAINIVLGFSIPNVNYIAHFGGLVAGFLTGLVMAPQYGVEWTYEATGPAPHLIDKRADRARWVTVGVAVLVLLALVFVGNQRWAG